MYLGFDTSNYTTSVALYDGKNIIQKKKILEVKKGERGLRQSEAVFQHTVNMPLLLGEIGDKGEFDKIDAVGVSSRPRSVEDSYMPCFLVGINTAKAISTFTKSNLYQTSHQVGHIVSAVYSVNRLDLLKEKFIAFHISGGTTEALLVEPDKDEIIKTTLIAKSNDLKAGQAIDRAGVLMEIKFPCGAELDRLAQNSDRNFSVKPSLKGADCSLSGLENKVKAMLESGIKNEDVSKFLFTYISVTIEEMTSRILDKYGRLPLVFAGGVMSNSIIRKNIQNKFDAYFTESSFSCDNACGTAIYAYLKHNSI